MSQMDREIGKLADYDTSYEKLIRKIRQERIILEPLETWTYLAEPILRALPRLRLMRPELEICCYSPAEAPFSALEGATRIARLALRVKATGKVEKDRWRSAITSLLDRNRELLAVEVSKLLLKARGRDTVCLAGLNAFRLKRRIAEHWASTIVRSVEPYYYRTPLEVLLFLLSRGQVADEQLSTLAQAHVEYIYKYILRSRDRDEAYNKWVTERILTAGSYARS
jgi:hypothetical protein